MPRRALQIRDPDGTVTTRWKLSFSERFQILFCGTIWLQVLTFNRRFKPVKLMTKEPVSRRTLLALQEAIKEANEPRIFGDLDADIDGKLDGKTGSD